MWKQDNREKNIIKTRQQRKTTNAYIYIWKTKIQKK